MSNPSSCLRQPLPDLIRLQFVQHQHDCRPQTHMLLCDVACVMFFSLLDVPHSR